MPSAYVFLGADADSLQKLSKDLFPEQTTGEDKIFIFPGNPIASLDPLPAELAEQGLTLARIIALIDAPLIEKRPELKNWFDALTHFADVLLLTNVKDVAPTWLNVLKKNLKGSPIQIVHWPEFFKKSPDSAIADITFPEARRLSQHFDVDATTIAAPIYIGENDDDLSKEDVEAAALAEEELDEIPLDPYFERDVAGRYVMKMTAP